MIIAIIIIQFVFMGRAIIALNIMLIIAYFVWLSGGEYKNPQPQKLITLYIFGIAVQCLHLCEEYVMDFQTRLPQFFNYTWSDSQFLILNLIWLSIFVTAIWGVLNKYRVSFLVIWFYAIAGGAVNGIFHLLLSIYLGTYFPGLITAFAHLVIGLLLIKELLSVRKGILS